MLSAHNLMKVAVEKQASDLHLIVGSHPVLRIHGDLVFLDEFGIIDAQKMDDMLKDIISDTEIKKFKEEMELDCSFSLSGVARFRVNVYMAQQSMGISIRVINPRVKNIEELGLPPRITDYCTRKSGLILVTGSTGSGKSTTLAAIIDFINKNKKCRIITIEDPIEYIYERGQSSIFQREVFQDTKSFPIAVRQTLRQDPDVICVGEMRDLETISTVLTLAETGHLVLSTLHTSNSVETINRIIDVFPPHQQEQIRVQVAACLSAVIAQKLLPVIDGSGRIVATELLVVDNAVKNLIKLNKIDQIFSILETGKDRGMHNMDSEIMRLYQRGVISKDVAYGNLVGKETRENLKNSPQ